MGTVQKQQRLSNGRIIRELPQWYTQAQMFTLGKSGLWEPKKEGIATVRELDDALNVARVYELLLDDLWSRSNLVGFYRRGFESHSQIGNKLVWLEKEVAINCSCTGRILVAVLDLSKIADEKVMLHNGNEISLQKAVGMGIIPISKLKLKVIKDTKKLIIYEVSVASDFDPAKDLGVKDVARSRSWSTSVDNDGFALNGGIVPDYIGWKNPSARYSLIIDSNAFLDINELPKGIRAILTQMGTKHEDLGYFGSVGRGIYYINYGDTRRYIFANARWSIVSGVLMVGREAATV